MNQIFDWQHVHRELSRLAKSRSHLDWEEGTWLIRARRSGVHRHLGFGSLAEYVERLFGYGPRWTEERLRVAEALEKLPAIEQALRDGAITWSTARELTRVAASGNEREWLEVARGRTARQVEEMVAGRRPGDAPHDPEDPSLRRHVLRMEVSAETLATFREAMAKLRRDAGESLDDDTAVLLLARTALEGPKEEGRANYQVAITVCEECQRGWQDARGERVEVGSDVIEMASCDAQRVGKVEAAPTHVGAARAHQDIPPAVRRKVLRRDGGRCVVPGCRHATFVDIHHLVLRSEGGGHDDDRLIVLCSAHHRAQHRGQLIIEGRVSTGLRFEHADGTRYGHVVDPRAANAHAEAFLALRNLGFREGETRAALDRVRSGDAAKATRRTVEGRENVDLDASPQSVIRSALALLSSSCPTRTSEHRSQAHP